MDVVSLALSTFWWEDSGSKIIFRELLHQAISVPQTVITHSKCSCDAAFLDSLSNALDFRSLFFLLKISLLITPALLILLQLARILEMRSRRHKFLLQSPVPRRSTRGRTSSVEKNPPLVGLYCSIIVQGIRWMLLPVLAALSIVSMSVKQSLPRFL